MPEYHKPSDSIEEPSEVVNIEPCNFFSDISVGPNGKVVGNDKLNEPLNLVEKIVKQREAEI